MLETLLHFNFKTAPSLRDFARLLSIQTVHQGQAYVKVISRNTAVQLFRLLSRVTFWVTF